MKFDLVFKTATANFPSSYLGQFFDYDTLHQVLKLAKIPNSQSTPVHLGPVEAANGTELFFKLLEMNLTKINQHFEKTSSDVIRQWRVLMGLEEQSVAGAPPVLAFKVALNARHCFQYVKLNEAALKRLLGDIDDQLKSSKGQHFLQDITSGCKAHKAFFMHSAKVEELRAIFRLYDIHHEEDKADDKRMSGGAIAMELFDCSFTTKWVPDLGDMSPYCHGCKKPMDDPMGITCGHIICSSCVNSLSGPAAAPKTASHLASAGVLVRQMPQVHPPTAQCPKCRRVRALDEVVECAALGRLFKETEKKPLMAEMAEQHKVKDAKGSKGKSVLKSLRRRLLHSLAVLA